MKKNEPRVKKNEQKNTQKMLLGVQRVKVHQPTPFIYFFMA